MLKLFGRERELDNAEDEVLVGELGKDDTSWKWIATTRARGVPLVAISPSRVVLYSILSGPQHTGIASDSTQNRTTSS